MEGLGFNQRLAMALDQLDEISIQSSPIGQINASMATLPEGRLAEACFEAGVAWGMAIMFGEIPPNANGRWFSCMEATMAACVIVSELERLRDDASALRQNHHMFGDSSDETESTDFEREDFVCSLVESRHAFWALQVAITNGLARESTEVVQNLLSQIEDKLAEIDRILLDHDVLHVFQEVIIERNIPLIDNYRSWLVEPFASEKLPWWIDFHATFQRCCEQGAAEIQAVHEKNLAKSGKEDLKLLLNLKNETQPVFVAFRGNWKERFRGVSACAWFRFVASTSKVEVRVQVRASEEAVELPDRLNCSVMFIDELTLQTDGNKRRSHGQMEIKWEAFEATVHACGEDVALSLNDEFLDRIASMRPVSVMIPTEDNAWLLCGA